MLRRLNVKCVFIIDKKTRVLIFLGLIDNSTSINQTELQTVLKSIVEKSVDLDSGVFAKAKMSETTYTFGNFDKLIVIAQHDANEEIATDLLTAIDGKFMELYSDVLDNYTEQDIAKFKSFVQVIKEEIVEHTKEKSGQVEEDEKKAEGKVEEPQKQVEPEQKIKPAQTVKTEAPKVVEINQDNIGEKQIIPPMKREVYAQGIPDYKRDEVLWEESQMVQNEYGADFVEGLIYNLKVFLTISLTHHYEVHIDFSDYPKRPKIATGEGLEEELGKHLHETLYLYKNWDTKRPPHIIELVREIEAVLMKFKAWGVLSETTAMPETALPDLEPLPELPPLEEPEKISNDKEEVKKQKQPVLEPEKKEKEEDLKIIPPELEKPETEEKTEKPEEKSSLPEQDSKSDKKEKKKKKKKKKQKKK